MLKVIRIIGNRYLLRPIITENLFFRNVLSEAYWCKEEWKQRLQTPALQSVMLDTYVTKLHEKMDKEGKISALDVDILANRLDEIDMLQMDRAQKLFQRFRSSLEARYMKPSTSYAIVRSLLVLNETDRLINILRDKIGYGVFLNSFSANLLMSYFIEHHQYQEAALVAYDMILQEELGHPMTRALALYSCLLHWKNPPPLIVSEAISDATAEEEEVVQVPVAFIENPWYDDHFDIPRDSLLLGKTFVQLGKYLDNSLGRSCQLIGCGLYEKFDSGLLLLENWLHSASAVSVSKQAIEFFGSSLDQVVTKIKPDHNPEPGTVALEDLFPYVTEEQKAEYKQRFQDLSSRLLQKNCVNNDDLDSEIKRYLDSVVQSDQQTCDIEEQIKIFKQWNEERQLMLNEQVRQYRIVQKKSELIQKLKDLQIKEEKLRYFEQLEKIGLGVAKAAIQIKPQEEKKEEEVFVAAPSERTKGSDKAGKTKSAKSA